MENKFNHLMVDIETMGNMSYSAILSIGAIEFDLVSGKTGRTFYHTIDLQSCFDIGLIVNADTIKWWIGQNDKAKIDLLCDKEALPIKKVLESFSSWFGVELKNYEIWGNSARFDLGILQNAYNKLNMLIPWDFRKERCVRTLVSFAPDIKENHKFNGTYHNPLDDCLNQIQYCSKIWKKINNIN